MMNGKIIRIWVILCLAIYLALPVFSVPMAINVQGRLIKGGNPVKVSTLVRFCIYSSLTGGDSDILWQNNIYVSPDNDGVFNTSLEGYSMGGSIPFPEFLSENYYLGILIYDGGWQPLSPRQRLVSVPFAITAKNLKGGIAEASGETAVKSAGLKVGGSFESTAAGSIALKGVTTASNGLGVYGQGTSAGGSFESSGASGYGLWSTTGDTTRAGIYAQNTGDGPALELGPGGIKLRTADATIVAWGDQTAYDSGKFIHALATAEAICGTVNYPYPAGVIHKWVGINNSYVKPGYKVFFATPHQVLITDWQITSNGKLWVEIYPGDNAAGFIQFWVIE